jgi:hypothetical protein
MTDQSALSWVKATATAIRIPNSDESLKSTNMRINFLSKIVFCALLSGCTNMAYPPQERNFDRGLQAIALKNFEVGYRFLEQPSPGTESDVVRLMRMEPELVDAGLMTFTESALSDSITSYGRAESFRIEHSRLQRFAVYATPDKFRVAADVMAQAYPKELATHHEQEAERARIANLPDAEQRQYWAEQFRRSVESVTVRGIIISSQLVNQSRAGTTYGASLGAGLGQATYIDSSSWRDYRATSQLTAGILGAVVGGILDQKPSTMYLKVYFIKTAAGEVRRIDERSPDQILLPNGACLEYREPFHIAIATEKTCLVNAAKPLQRYRLEAEALSHRLSCWHVTGGSEVATIKSAMNQTMHKCKIRAEIQAQKALPVGAEM